MLIGGKGRWEHNNVVSLNGSAMPSGAAGIADLPYPTSYHMAGMVRRPGEQSGSL